MSFDLVGAFDALGGGEPSDRDIEAMAARVMRARPAGRTPAGSVYDRVCPSLSHHDQVEHAEVERIASAAVAKAPPLEVVDDAPWWDADLRDGESRSHQADAGPQLRGWRWG